jgi:drug/metabolite transporter (DMT)-like permease
MSQPKHLLLVIFALFCTYFIWGSTYLAIYFGVASFPPFLLAGTRFVIAGVILYSVMRWMGAPHPTWRQWGGASIVGLLLPAMGNGTVCYVQQTVSSSVAALAIATAPIWIAIFSAFWGHKITKQEWLGIMVGFIGIVLLNTNGTLSGDATSAFLLLFAAACWSFGSVWGKYLTMPVGLMGAACQMMVGGMVLLLVSAFAGEVWPESIADAAWVAMAFLIVLSSLVAYSAYQWLLQNVRPLIAISNTFVNPIVAFIMGITFAGDMITGSEYMALAVILVGVLLVLTANAIETKK